MHLPSPSVTSGTWLGSVSKGFSGSAGVRGRNRAGDSNMHLQECFPVTLHGFSGILEDWDSTLLYSGQAAGGHRGCSTLPVTHRTFLSSTITISKGWLRAVEQHLGENSSCRCSSVPLLLWIFCPQFPLNPGWVLLRT